jgi:hypothetical protein
MLSSNWRKPECEFAIVICFEVLFEPFKQLSSRYAKPAFYPAVRPGVNVATAQSLGLLEGNHKRTFEENTFSLTENNFPSGIHG